MRARPPAQLPKFWRPKLPVSVRTTAQIVHWDLITRFTDGTAGAEELWDWIETGFTYSQIARLLAADGVEFDPAAMNTLAEQLDSYESVFDRLRKTGRIGFDAAQLRIARAAAEVMDALIDMDRHGIAERAARWSVDQMAAMRKRAPAHP
jgi:hypothetical protein